MVAAFVLINAFFVASEFALVSIRRSRIDELIAQGAGAAKAVRRAVDDLDRYIAGTQVGITIASLALGWVGEPLVARLIEPGFRYLPEEVSPAVLHTVAYGVSFLFITFFHVVLGELVPKSVALQQAERVALTVARPMALIVAVFHPVIIALNGFGNILLRVIGFQPAGEYHNVHSVEELGILVTQSHKAGVLDDLEKKILERTFHFTELTAGAISTPRMDIDAINAADPVEEQINQLAESAHTRLPLYEESIDNVVGIVHVQAVFRAIRAGVAIKCLRDLAQPPVIVPESILLDSLVEQFREHHTKIAVVVDEHGATAGLVTFKDIVEEVFGNIQTAPGEKKANIQKLADGRVLVHGDIRLDELNRELGWNIEDEDVDTIAGLVMKHLGRVAKVNDVIELKEGRVRVVRMEKVRIIELALEAGS